MGAQYIQALWSNSVCLNETKKKKNHTVSNTVIFHQVFKTYSSVESRGEVLKKFTRNNDKTFNVTYKSLCSATDAAEVTDSGRKTVFIKHSFI